MKISGSASLNAPVGRVWSAVRDPDVLAVLIPGCQRLDRTGPGSFAITVSTGLAAVRGSYFGQIELAGQQPAEAAHTLVLHADAAGERGTLSADARIELTEAAGGGTRIGYDLDAVAGGAIAGTGELMLAAIAQRVTEDFAAALDQRLADDDAGRSARVAAQARHPAAGRDRHDRAAGTAVPAQAGPAGSNGSGPAVPGQGGPGPGEIAENQPEPDEAELAEELMAIPAQRSRPGVRSIRRPMAGEWRRLLPAREIGVPAGVVVGVAAGLAAGVALGVMIGRRRRR